MAWIRYRFTMDIDDYRPTVFPPPGPYWCTGETPDGAHILVAYLRPGDMLHGYWPEADDDEEEPVDAITFTTRFPRPEWYTGPLT
jgi:hypothetical protein